MTEAEKAKRRLQRKAAAINARTQAEMPLFAALEPKATYESEYWRQRFKLARSITGDLGPGYASPGAAGLAWVELHAIERWARQLLGTVAEKLIDYVRRTYPMPDYGNHVWGDILTGRKRIELDYQPVKDRKPGEPAVRCSEAYEATPTVSREEWDARFGRDRFPPPFGGVFDTPAVGE